MDRNREARRAAAMANGLHRRRHRTTTSTEDEGQMELQETAARLRDRVAKKDRDREMRDRDRDRDREHDRDRDRDRDRERLSRSKRRRRDKYIREDGVGGGGGGGGGGNNSGVDDSSEESVNHEDDEDEDSSYHHHQHQHHLPPTNPVPISAAVASTTLTSHRKSYPPPSKVYKVTPSWKAPDEMIGVSIPRKARSASTKRSHECWSSGGVGGDQINRQASSSPVMDAAAVGTIQSASPARPMSPSSSIKKKLTNGPKQRPPKSSSTKSSPSPLIQDEIEIEVAEVLYGLMRQSQAPPSESPAAVKPESRSTNVDSKPPTPSLNPPSTSSSTPITVTAPKRKRPRQSSDENPVPTAGPRASPVSAVPKQEVPSMNTEKNEGSAGLSSEPTPPPVSNNGILSDKFVRESGEARNGVVRTTTKVEEASSSSPKLASSQINDRVQLSSTSSKPNSSAAESDNYRKEDKCKIDLMAPASPEKGDYVSGGGGGGDEKSMVTDKEMEAKPKAKPNEVVPDDDKAGKMITCGGVETGDEAKAEKSEPHRKMTTIGVSLSSASLSPQRHQRSNPSRKERSFDLGLDLETASVNDDKNKLNFQQQKQQLPRNDPHLDKIGGQPSSVPMPMSVPTGWHGGLAPMGYVGPLQGVVSMDGTTMATPPIQPPPLPHFMFTPPKPKRCATHGHIAKSIAAHQQLMKMNPFWPAAAAAGTAQLFGAKPYNLNLVPSSDPGRGGVSAVQDIKGQPFTLFPGPPPSATTKDKSPQAGSVPDSAQKKQFLGQPGLPPGSAANIMHGPALFFPMGQQQASASGRPGSGKSPSTGSGAASMSTSTSAPIGATVSNAPPAGPAMSFSYPNVNGNEAQFMAILGNNPYPFPIPAHVGAAPPYRGSHPQAMSFFNGSFYSSQMLHPSQLQQAQPGPVSSQSMQQAQQQNQQIASISTASSSSQKHLQSQQQRHQGSGANNVGNPNQSTMLQSFQGTKGRDIGGEDSPSSADSRRSNMSLYGPNFPMPFHSPNFALIPSSLSGAGNNGPGVASVNNHGDKKQQQSQQAAMNAPFPMSFTTINGVNTPGLDISSMAHNHAIFQSLPEAAKQSYQMMAAAAAAQAAQQRMSSYRGLDDGKNGAATASDPSNLDEERRTMAARASAASGGQSIAFSRDLAENSVVDSSARSLNLGNGSSRPARSSGSNNMTNSSNLQQQQQQQSQMLFPKQQQYTPSSAGNARSKTPSTSNGNVYPDHLTSSSVMAAKFPNSLSGFPSLAQPSGGVSTTSQWKNSVRPNTSQMSSPSITSTSTPQNLKNLPQQQGRPQQTHTQISFGAAVTNSKPNPSSQGPQTQNTSQTPSSPMMVGSPSNSSMSKSAGGSPRTSASNKSVGQTSTLSSQQGKNSPSPSLSTQKPSILGGPHMMSTPSPAGKPQLQQQPHQQPQLSKQTIQQAQLYFSNYMQQAANTSSAMAGTGYYLQRHPKSQTGSVPATSSSGMLSLPTPVSFANVSTSDPTKAAASNMKSGLNSQAMSQSGGAAARQLMPASLPYTSGAAPVKPTEQKHPSGE
ncbi:hypothetical protein vseg_007923 [Gypsophila vaccaria]